MFKNIKLKSWPDYVLAVCGTSIVTMVGIDQLAKEPLSASILFVVIGGFIVGVAGKIAVYRVRDPELGGNVWRDEWRRSKTVDAVAFLGAAITGFGLFSAALPLMQ